jgi:hypothetical protein
LKDAAHNAPLLAPANTDNSVAKLEIRLRLHGRLLGNDHVAFSTRFLTGAKDWLPKCKKATRKSPSRLVVASSDAARLFHKVFGLVPNALLGSANQRFIARHGAGFETEWLFNPLDPNGLMTWAYNVQRSCAGVGLS